MTSGSSFRSYGGQKSLSNGLLPDISIGNKQVKITVSILIVNRNKRTAGSFMRFQLLQVMSLI